MEKTNNKSHIIPEKTSAVNEIQYPIVVNVTANMNSPIVVSPAVYTLRVVLPCHTSLSCGSSMKPKSILTTAITISCQI